MSNAFEDAMHHGYSAEEMAQDMKEWLDTARRLGCTDCIYGKDYHVTCYNIIQNEDNYIKCPFYKKEEEV